MVALARRHAGTDSGFTLIELLVALLIIGLMLGLAVPVLRPNSQSQLRDEAERLAQLFELAGSESRFSGRSMIWTSDGQGYRFRRADTLNPGSVIRDDDLWRQHRLPVGMRLSELSIEALPITGPMRLNFESDGSAAAFSLTLSMAEERLTVRAAPLGEVQVVSATGANHALAAYP